MNRNVSIVVVLLVLVVIVGYLIWIRSRVTQPVSPEATPVVTATPVATPEITASPSATPGAKQATSSAKPKTATQGANVR